MSDLDRIPPYLHPRVVGIEAPEYAGKLSSTLLPDEQVELAAIGQFAPAVGGVSLATVPCKPALLVSTNQRLLAIYPTRRGLLGPKSPEPGILSFSASQEGNVYDAGFVIAEPRRAIASVCGAAPGNQPGRYLVWVMDVGDADNGNLWAITMRASIEQNGGDRRRPNGL